MSGTTNTRFLARMFSQTKLLSGPRFLVYKFQTEERAFTTHYVFFFSFLFFYLNTTFFFFFFAASAENTFHFRGTLDNLPFRDVNSTIVFESPVNTNPILVILHLKTMKFKQNAGVIEAWGT